MFKSIRLRNFKIFKDTGPVPLAPLTVFFGKNNSGKSSIFHALLALAQTVEEGSADASFVMSGTRVKLGSFPDVVHRTTPANAAIGLDLELDRSQTQALPAAMAKSVRAGATAGLSLRLKLDRESNKVVVSSSHLRGGEDLDLRVSRAGTGYRFSGLTKEFRPHLIAGLINFFPFAFLGEAPEDDDLQKEILNRHYAWREAFQYWYGALSAIKHVTPLRRAIPRYSAFGEAPGYWVGEGGSALLRDLRSDRPVAGAETLLAYVNDWVSKRFDVFEQLRLQLLDPGGSIVSLVADEKGGCQGINLANAGSGVSQLLPIVAAVAKTPERGLLLVEQPEIHLHPALQADLADLFVDGANRGGQRQFFVETHSEHLLLRLRRRVVEQEIDANDVAVFVVERTGDSSRVTRVGIMEDGELEGWPSGFFQDDYREALALLKSAHARLK